MPDLGDYKLLLTGGVDYGFMCAACRLSSGQKASDMSLGLYPVPTNLSLIHEKKVKHRGNNKDAQARDFGL